MEEGLVLNRRETRVVEEAAVHEVSLFEKVALSRRCLWGLPVKLSIPKFLGVLDHLNGVVSCLWIEPALHEDVEEETHCCIVREPTVDVSRPKQGVRRRLLGLPRL